MDSKLSIHSCKMSRKQVGQRPGGDAFACRRHERQLRAQKDCTTLSPGPLAPGCRGSRAPRSGGLAWPLIVSRPAQAGYPAHAREYIARVTFVFGPTRPARWRLLVAHALRSLPHLWCRVLSGRGSHRLCARPCSRTWCLRCAGAHAVALQGRDCGPCCTKNPRAINHGDLFLPGATPRTQHWCDAATASQGCMPSQVQLHAHARKRKHACVRSCIRVRPYNTKEQNHNPWMCERKCRGAHEANQDPQ